MKFMPASTQASSRRNDIASSTVQPKTLPPRQMRETCEAGAAERRSGGFIEAIVAGAAPAASGGSAPRAGRAGALPRILAMATQGRQPQLRRGVDPRPEGPRAGQAAARACTRAPRARCTSSRRSIDNAADEALAGARDSDRRHAARRRLGQRRRRRPRHPVRPASRKKASASSRSSSRGCTPAASSTRARGGAYSFSGGLHGVGVSVTNALAKRLEVTVWRGGQVATIAFAGGDVVEPLAMRKAGGRRAQERHRACASGPIRATSRAPSCRAPS